MPFMYGSYHIYKADRETQQYQVSTLFNLTSQDAPALYPHFMYESILRTANGDPNFKFTLRNSPLPLTPSQQSEREESAVFFMIFIVAVGYSVSITGLVSHLVTERVSGLLHS